MVRQNYKFVQDRAIQEVFLKGEGYKKIDDIYKLDKDKGIYINENDDNYTTTDLVADLTDAFKLPNILSVKNIPPDQDKDKEKGNPKNVKKLLKKGYLKFHEGISYMEDE